MGEGPGGALGERSVMQIYRHAPTLDEITGFILLERAG